jgi:5-methyltetrahydrofolate--homocysteine methyltransferase
MALLDEICELVVKGHINIQSKYPPELAQKPGVEEKVKEAIDQNTDIGDILRKGLIAGMEVVGDKFSKGEYFVPEMLFSAKAMKAGLALLRPHMVDQEAMTIGKVILGTIQGDMHDIGKNLVAMMLEGAGFEVIDLGINTAPEKFLEEAQKNPNALVGMSALLTITMGRMRDVVQLFNSKGLNNKIFIGGAPVTQEYADQIGAHGFAPDASKAVHKAKELLKIGN